MGYEVHPWKVVEKGLEESGIRISESLTSIGNGYMGMRGNFEEDFSGDTHWGTYLAGVWFPDKTRVGWWKNGYPQYFGKAINAVRLMGIQVKVDGVPWICTGRTSSLSAGVGHGNRPVLPPLCGKNPKGSCGWRRSGSCPWPRRSCWPFPMPSPGV